MGFVDMRRSQDRMHLAAHALPVSHCSLSNHLSFFSLTSRSFICAAHPSCTFPLYATPLFTQNFHFVAFLRFHGMLLAQCIAGWRRITWKKRRKSWYLVDSTVVRSITCRLVFDGSIDGRTWKDSTRFRTQLQVDISHALSHLSGGLQASSLLKPFAADQMMTQIKVGRIDIKDFSVEVEEEEGYSMD